MLSIAGLWLVLSLVSVVAIAVSCARRPQHMAVMSVTWPLTALYFGPVAWWLYAAFGRTPTRDAQGEHTHHHHHQGHEHHHEGHHGDGASLKSTFVSTTHCGGGCAIGDLVGETLAAILAVHWFGSATLGAWGTDLVLAFLAGILFQYASIKPMSPDMSAGQALMAAIKADTLSILAFEVGMFAVMGLRLALAPDLSISEPTFWIWMQAAMLAGFATSMPANWLLVRAGLKHAM